jgi:DNA polymerase elongation subunit (family B)
VYDCETKTFGLPNPDKDILRLFGCYSYKTKKFYLLTDKEEIQKVINNHKFLVGFNTEAYDEPVIKRAGIDIQYKIRIDLYDIIKKRTAVIKIKEGILNDLLMSYSLDYITKTLKLADEETGKISFDYTLFNKESWNSEELRLIREYTMRDLVLTKKLYEWLEEYFWSLRDFLNEDDVKRKRYLTVTIAKVCYKAICNELKWTEEYEKNYEQIEEDERISGGYVAFPSGEEFHQTDKQNIYLLDFVSLYSHIMIQCNLYGRRKNNEDKPFWNGNGVWKVEGSYFTDKLAGVGELLKKWYNDRVKYKKEKNPKEYALKIMLNTIYGVLNTPYYMRVYDIVAGGDCTRIGRQWIRYARKTFRENGYGVAYTDTDSIYIIDPYKNKDKMLDVKKQIINYIKSTVPFSQDTFDVAFECEIKHLYFFKGENISEKNEEMDEDDYINKSKQLMKKNYIFVDIDNKLTIKNLGIRKKSNSPLSRKIFNEYLVPQIIEGKIKFSKTYFRNLIYELLSKDITLAAMRKEVGSLEDYKKSTTGLQAQISAKYGAGIYFLIPNLKKIGVGKGKSYCTLTEFREHKLTIQDIDLENVFNELEYFTKQAVNKNIFAYGG